MTDKKDIRSHARARRDGIPAYERAQKSRTICSRLIELVDKRAQGRRLVVAAYAAMGSEVDLTEFLDAMYARNHTVCLPCMIHVKIDHAYRVLATKTQSDDAFLPSALMKFVPLPRAAVLAEQRPAFLEHPARPVDGDALSAEGFAPIDEKDIDVVIAPLVAFDDDFNRMGYGGGNYDRFLPLVREDALVVGAAFEEQRVEHVPTEPHDRPLPLIVSA